MRPTTPVQLAVAMRLDPAHGACSRFAMGRIFDAFATLVFSVGALAGWILVASLALEHRFSVAAVTALSATFLTWGAWALGRDWQRARRARRWHRAQRESSR